jgi:hypothetical protein
MFYRLKPLVILMVIAVLSSVAIRAQGPEGKISGVVRDATGAALPGATITVANRTTNASQNTVTAADGTYSLSLPSGAYSVTVL